MQTAWGDVSWKPGERLQMSRPQAVQTGKSSLTVLAQVRVAGLLCQGQGNRDWDGWGGNGRASVQRLCESLRRAGSQPES